MNDAHVFALILGGMLTTVWVLTWVFDSITARIQEWRNE